MDVGKHESFSMKVVDMAKKRYERRLPRSIFWGGGKCIGREDM